MSWNSLHMWRGKHIIYAHCLLVTPCNVQSLFLQFFGDVDLVARLRGRTATQRSKKKGSEKVLGRVLGKDSQKVRGPAMGFTVKKGSENGSRKGFWEGGFQKLTRTPWRARPLRRAPYRPPRKTTSEQFWEKHVWSRSVWSASGQEAGGWLPETSWGGPPEGFTWTTGAGWVVSPLSLLCLEKCMKTERSQTPLIRFSVANPSTL